MTPLARRVARGLDRVLGSEPVAPGGARRRLAVAVSGGSDSVALLRVLHEIRRDAEWELVGVIHVNHGLRGAVSDADEQFCRELAERLELSFDCTTVDVSARADQTGRSVEVAARELRYAAFEEAAGRLRADLVATGHTLDDQAETVMLRLLRGASARGLSAVRRRRGRYVRPLLDITRHELLEHLELVGESFREDETNADVNIPRNQIRHQLMPVIEQVAPGGARALARSAELAAEDEAFFRAAVIEAAGFVVLSSGDAAERAGTWIDTGALATIPSAVARRLVRDLAERVSGRSCTALHIRAVLELARADKRSGHLDLPGLEVERRGHELVMLPAGAEKPRTLSVGPFEYRLPVPGVVEVPEAGLHVVATVSATANVTRADNPDIAMVQESAMVLPLAVRNRRPGDRVRPLGAPGRRKLQDMLVDRKVPSEERDLVPLVVDARGHLVWVAGLAIAHDCRVTASDAGVVVLELRR